MRGTHIAMRQRRGVFQDAPCSGVRLAVLLLGARGAGKATAARAAAAALGLHLVPFSCAELAAEGQAADALHGAFEAAQPFTPALLLLRHFGTAAAGAPGVTGAKPAYVNVTRVGMRVWLRLPMTMTVADTRMAVNAMTCVTTVAWWQAREIQLQRGWAPSCQRASLLARARTAGWCWWSPCAESVEDVPAPLRRCFTHELALEAPNEAQRLVLLQVHAGSLCTSCARMLLCSICDIHKQINAVEWVSTW